MTVEQSGKVYLVGSGPGSIAHLTIKGHQCLTQAEVLVYDALVDAALLEFVSDRCLTVDVGKRGGKPSTSQAEINRLLVQHCQEGRQVVRLKSGDPFIFGRSTSEIEALKNASCDFEVVPGLSSALAAPLLADIPLTDPVLSRCFAVLSAHEPDALNWEALSQLETLVILMGGKHVAEIVYQLESHGRSRETPIAIVRWAGHAQQQIWTGTLGTILQQIVNQSLSPAVIIIGQVVALRPFLQSPQNRQNNFQFPLASACDKAAPIVSNLPPSLPLQGKTILVTRSAGQSSQFTRLLQEQAAEVIEMPVLEIGPPSNWEALDQAIAQLPTFNWLILTSTNGVDYFFERLATQHQDARALAGIKIAVVGQKTATSLQKWGLQPDFIPPDFVADALVEHFPDGDRLNGTKILFPRVESGGRDVLVKEFTAKGVEVTEVAAYQSGCARAIAPETLTTLQTGKVNIITFASSKTVQCFHQLISSIPHPPFSLDNVCIASIGPQTSTTCQQLWGRVDVEAEEHTLEGLTQAIVAWQRQRNSTLGG
jgi:uroporphyrinogen III methyltransferase/synthase